MSIYHVIIERSGLDDVHERVTVEAADLDEAKQPLEARFEIGKVISLRGETESQNCGDPGASAQTKPLNIAAELVSRHSYAVMIQLGARGG